MGVDLHEPHARAPAEVGRVVGGRLPHEGLQVAAHGHVAVVDYIIELYEMPLGMVLRDAVARGLRGGGWDVVRGEIDCRWVAL